MSAIRTAQNYLLKRSRVFDPILQSDYRKAEDQSRWQRKSIDLHREMKSNWRNYIERRFLNKKGKKEKVRKIEWRKPLKRSPI